MTPTLRDLGIVQGEPIRCPHCSVQAKFSWITVQVGERKDLFEALAVQHGVCPVEECQRPVVRFSRAFMTKALVIETRFIYPKTATRTTLSPDVPDALREDYTEACAVLNDSPKASAALSRRCLQQMLRDHTQVKPADLYDEIAQAIVEHKVPGHLAENLDVVRIVGNLATHPIKSKSTGQIVPVETGEAEWNLEVVESLLDYYFVQVPKNKERRDSLKAKAIDAGKKLRDG